MGKIIYLDRVRALVKSSPIFRQRDIELIVKSKSYSYLVLHNLVRRGEIKRVSKGWYSSYEDPIVAVFCFKPAYIGLQDALSFHELWEQETAVVIITTRRVRVGVRKILDSNVLVRRLKQKYFFGFDYIKYENLFIPVSDIEKTLIDLVYFNEIPGKAVLQQVKRSMDKNKLAGYLKRYPAGFRKRVYDLMFDTL